MSELKRVREQEGGNVLRWFEDGRVTASLVEGDIPGEAEWRVSSPKVGSFKVRGHKERMLRDSDQKMIQRIKYHVEREEKYGPKGNPSQSGSPNPALGPEKKRTTEWVKDYVIIQQDPASGKTHYLGNLAKVTKTHFISEGGTGYGRGLYHIIRRKQFEESSSPRSDVEQTSSRPALTIEALKGELSGFTGAIERYRHFTGLTYTEGIKYLADRAEAHWLLDAIFSYQGDPKIKALPFQIWTLNVLRSELGKDRSEPMAILEMREDTGEPVKVSQKILYTDFPQGEIKLYLVDGVLLLPSEY